MSFFTYQADVIKVIDGDTIEVNLDLGFNIRFRTTLRLAEFDAPETFRPKTPEEKERGLACKKELERLLPVGSTVTIRTVKDKKEKYGRYLAHVVTGSGIDVASHLVVLGFSK